MTKHKLGVLIAVLGLLAVCAPGFAHPGGVNEPSPTLPPLIVPGVYLSPSDVHAKYSGPALAIVLSMVEHQPYAALPPRTFCDPTGGGQCHEDHEMQTDLRVMVDVNGMGPQPMTMTGPVTMCAHYNKPNPLGTGTYDVEMISMSLTGTFMGNTVMIRESPSKASTGKTSITDIGGGMWHIDSFFDVFTELSLNGGPWIPKAGLRGTRVNLGGVPEPASIMLVGLALVGLAGMSRRRK